MTIHSVFEITQHRTCILRFLPLCPSLHVCLRGDTVLSLLIHIWFFNILNHYKGHITTIFFLFSLLPLFMTWSAISMVETACTGISSISLYLISVKYCFCVITSMVFQIYSWLLTLKHRPTSVSYLTLQHRSRYMTRQRFLSYVVIVHNWNAWCNDKVQLLF